MRTRTFTVTVTFSSDEGNPLPIETEVAAALAHSTAAEALSESTGCEVHMEMGSERDEDLPEPGDFPDQPPGEFIDDIDELGASDSDDELASIKTDLDYALRQLRLGVQHPNNPLILADCCQRGLDALDRMEGVVAS